jgi:1-deoxy-D-xylulose-5-phosphate reductoisomerase
VRRIILTASGGPFRETPSEELAGMTPSDALDHPTWDMGRKITVDSATLANKALEVVEAHYLFGIPYDRIEVVVHPQSVVHSMVELRDGSVLAQLGDPDMELPILHALAHPECVEEEVRAFDPVRSGPLTFERPRREDFPMLGLGVGAGRRGGTAPAVFNAANEVAVEAFLQGRLDFPGIPRLVERCLEELEIREVREVSDVWEADARARELARDVLRAGTSGAAEGAS